MKCNEKCPHFTVWGTVTKYWLCKFAGRETDEGKEQEWCPRRKHE
jgi:hypothetical protein